MIHFIVMSESIEFEIGRAIMDENGNDVEWNQIIPSSAKIFN